MKFMAVGLVAFLPSLCATGGGIDDEVQRGAGLSGREYLAARNAVMYLNTNAIPPLMSIEGDEERTWQVRLVAGIWRERLLKGPLIETLASMDWATVPGFRPEWNAPMTGPAPFLTPLVEQKFVEADVPYYLLESYWKSTGETGRVGKWHYDLSVWGLAAVAKSPLRPYLVEVFKEDLRNDPELRGQPHAVPRSRLSNGDIAYTHLLEWKSRRSLPLLLQKWDKRGRPDGTLWKDFFPMMTADDMPLLERYRDAPAVPHIISALKNGDKQSVK